MRYGLYASWESAQKELPLPLREGVGGGVCARERAESSAPSQLWSSNSDLLMYGLVCAYRSQSPSPYPLPQGEGEFFLYRRR
jgi:hypothetical protein